MSEPSSRLEGDGKYTDTFSITSMAASAMESLSLEGAQPPRPR